MRRSAQDRTACAISAFVGALPVREHRDNLYQVSACRSSQRDALPALELRII